MPQMSMGSRSDLAGYSVFEEAFTAGHRVAHALRP